MTKNLIISFLLLLISYNGFSQSFIHDNWKEDNSLDSKASFPSGQDSLYNFVITNLKIPSPSYKQDNFDWVSIAYFNVDESGKISGITFSTYYNDTTLNNAVKLVIDKMPLWNPAILKGKPVNSKVRFPTSLSWTLSNKRQFFSLSEKMKIK